MKLSHSVIFILILCLFSCVSQDSNSQSSNSFTRISAKTYPIEVVLSENDSSYFERDIIVDLSSSDFIINNFGGIVAYKLEDLKFEISAFNGSESVQSDFIISFIDANGSLGSPVTYGDIPLYTFWQNQNLIIVNHSSATINQVEESMGIHKELIVHIEGMVSEKPVDFEATFYITINISGK